MFESTSNKWPLPFRWMKIVCVVLLSIYLVIGLMAAYRAWFQVKSLTLETNDPVLWSGSVIHTSLVSYARTTIDVQVELIQRQHSETIARQRLSGNDWAFFDPRSRQAEQSTVLTNDLLRRFNPGVAQLHATAIGREQWTRLPPPVIREMTVAISPN